MGNTFRIEPAAIYDDAALMLGMGLTSATLTLARRAGHLRFTRKGRRVLYRGQWILDWMDQDHTQTERGTANE